MRIQPYLAVCASITMFATADSEPDRMAGLEEAARVAGIKKELILDSQRRPELVEALRRRIIQGYVDEQAFKSHLRRLNPPKGQYGELRKPYLETKGKGFDRALFLASELSCVELVPLLVSRGDMGVLDYGGPYQKGESARAVKAIVAMGPTAIGPLFKVVERSPRAKERYYALSALQLGQTAWKDDLEEKGLVERLEEQCDTSKPTVQLALALLKGHIKDARTAAGQDLDRR